MKKIISILMVLLLMFAVTACGDKEASSQDSSDELLKEAEQAKEDVEAMYGSQEYSWPNEADVLGVPELKKGKINGLGITDKAVAIGYEGLKRDDIMSYIEQLKKEGFVEGMQYPGGSMWNYIKNEENGAVDVTIAYGDEDKAASIIINPKDGKLNILNEPAGELKWLDSIPKDVPVFSKGTIVKAADNSSILTMGYEDVKQSDVDAYKKALTDVGFVLDEVDSSANSSQFEKEDVAKMSIIIVGVDFNDGYLTLTIASV